MNVDRITEHTAEIVTEPELEALATTHQPRSYWGVAPTGPPHLGYYRVLEKQRQFVEAGFDHSVLIADLHAYLDDEKCPWSEMERRATVYQRCFELLGLDVTYVRGSEFQRSTAYVDDLYRSIGVITSNRAERAAAEVVRGDSPTLGSLVYPVMQSLDCKYLDVDLALGGIDQRHVYMLSRELLSDLGFGSVCFVFTPLGVDPGGGKMAASSGEQIELWTEREALERRIGQAYCPPETVTDNPVLEYALHFVLPQLGTVAVDRPRKYGGNTDFTNRERLIAAYESGDLHPADLKTAVIDGVYEALTPVREFFAENRDLLATFD